MIRFCFLSVLFIGLLGSCGKSGGAKMVGFEMTNVAGSESDWAIKRDHQGNILEQGPVLNGLPNGAWTAYDFEKGTPTSITSLVAGKKSGPYIEFNKKSEMQLYAEYFSDKLHGKRVEFGTIGRFLKEANYENGVLQGEYKEWSNSGKLKRTMFYLDGKLHGPFALYDQKGNKVAEYKYQHGEKISGGVVEQEAEIKE